MSLFRVSRRHRVRLRQILKSLQPLFPRSSCLLLLGLLIFLKSQDSGFFFDSSAHLFGEVPTDSVTLFSGTVDSLAGGAEFLLRTSNIPPRSKL